MIWYVAMVTGRICFVAPEYSAISSGCSVVLSSNSSIHCRTAVVLVVRINVEHCSCAMHPIPTMVLPGAAREHDDAGAAARAAAGVKGAGRFHLVVAHGEREVGARGGRTANCSASPPRNRPGPPPDTDFDERLLEIAAQLADRSRNSVFVSRERSRCAECLLRAISSAIGRSLVESTSPRSSRNS